MLLKSVIKEKNVLKVVARTILKIASRQFKSALIVVAITAHLIKFSTIYQVKTLHKVIYAQACKQVANSNNRNQTSLNSSRFYGKLI